MIIELKYFGKLVEITGRQTQELRREETTCTLKEIQEWVINNHPKIADESVQWAVNQQIVSSNFEISGNAEVALLPPFAGG